MSDYRDDNYPDYGMEQISQLTEVITDSAPVIASVMPKLPAGTCGPGLITYSYQLDGVTITADPKDEWSTEFRESVKNLIVAAFAFNGWPVVKVMVGGGRSVRVLHPREVLLSRL
ncbi:hypothetical protein [Streptomyces sp. NRRL B-24484]|uniref:hypothetical protein n=1 Tax=Streptomyces sp. NRRL B-24484 TaxID=1463833 RepID=UPI0004BE5CB2|nr:hypothetical protein [Streptomyces sp. NRRL B-24484]